MQDLFGHVEEPPASPLPARRRSGFAGYSWTGIAIGAVLIGTSVWGAWITREVIKLKSRRIVAVSLSAMINDFVMAEARSGNSPEQVERDTRHFMALLQDVLKKRAQDGTTILVGEAVVSGSVPDVTAEVRGEVGRLITANAPAAAPTLGAVPQRLAPVPSSESAPARRGVAALLGPANGQER